MLTTQQLSRIFLPLSFGKRSGNSASLYEIINSYLKLFPTNKVVVNSSAPAATITIGDAANNGDTDGAVSIVGNKYAGQITVETGDATAADDVICTVNLNDSKYDESVNTLFVQITPVNADTAPYAVFTHVEDALNPGGEFTLNNSDTPLVAATTYVWNYTVHYI